MMYYVNPSRRYSAIGHFALFYLSVSFLLRLAFMVWQYDEVDWHPVDLLRTLLSGTFFDLGALAYLVAPCILYITVWPSRWIGTLADKAIIWFFTSLGVVILAFTFFAEVTFWEEFRSRFNFVAVDYLIYTHEVIANINESYPLPLLIGGVLAVSILVLWLFFKRKVFKNTFAGKPRIGERVLLLMVTAAFIGFYSLTIRNFHAEWSPNRYNSEISKNGIYSFFAAFRNNQMKYPEFYTAIPDAEAFARVREKLGASGTKFNAEGLSIRRDVENTAGPEKKYNVVFVLVESLSASFMSEFGNTENITPFLDSLAQQSTFFENMYATGNRTVRGMEAVTLCIPPTPGQSIVKRPENQGLYTINSVFEAKGYTTSFLYGGDGYFDNMNAYFGGNGFDIYDRGRGSILSDKIRATRTLIRDNEVRFENAWGICDEDIYSKMLSVADENYRAGKPFFNFVMTTSNHRPYTYPANRIDIPSGTGRRGAVKYTDYALKKMLQAARSKPWFSNTVFVIVADHCASSAGRNEIDVANYRIPAFIFNIPQAATQKVGKQCSQIDLFPTLFGMMGWNYTSNFFGKDIFGPDFEERALIATYRKLALLKKNRVMILSDQKKQNFYRWDSKSNNLSLLPTDKAFLEETIAWYQTADYLFNHKLLK